MLGNKAGRNSKANESGRDESLKECSTPSDSTIPAESLTRNLKEDRDRDFEKKNPWWTLVLQGYMVIAYLCRNHTPHATGALFRKDLARKSPGIWPGCRRRMEREWGALYGRSPKDQSILDDMT